VALVFMGINEFNVIEQHSFVHPERLQ